MPLASIQSLEAAAFAAWPSRETEVFKGWHLRFDKGYTKRANSANASDQAIDLSASDLDHIERKFRSHGLSPVFRLTSHAPMTETDQRLIQRGYRMADLSMVMTAPLLQPLGTDVHEVALEVAPHATAWLSHFEAIAEKTGSDTAAHLDILNRIEGQTAFALKTESHGPVSCGLGVVSGDRLGLFDIATHPAHRHRGLAAALCRDLMAWGHAAGARVAYLQVVATNTSAIRLYEQLGFRVAYHYGYRVMP